MSKDYVLKLQDDLRKKFDRLSLMHNEPALHVADHFAELRRQVDLDAERLLSEIQSVKRETGKAPKGSDVNGTRMEFIRILEELEKRTGHQPKPQAASSQVYASLEQRVEAFKDSSSSLDDLDEFYIQLAREIIDESDRVEQRVFGEQTIIYWPHQKKSELGSLVYFGDQFLFRKDIERLRRSFFVYQSMEDIRHPVQDYHKIYNSSYLVPVRVSNEIRSNKSEQAIEMFLHFHYGGFGQASRFIYIGKTKQEYSGYSAKGSKVDRKFVSHQYHENIHQFLHKGGGDLKTSVNVFDNFSSTRCKLYIEDHRLESLHANLLPTPAARLTELVLKGVHLESFDTYHLIAACTNLTRLDLETTYSKGGVKFDLNFLGALNKLETLRLTLPNVPSDFSVLKELSQLKDLKLKGSSFFYAEKLAKLSKAALLQIVSPPCLNTLELSCFDIEAINREMLSKCRNLTNLELTLNRICPARVDQIAHLGFPLCYESPRRFPYLEAMIRLMHNDIRALSSSSFVGMKNLTELSLTGNSIVDLPLGVFQDLSSLQRLELDKNRIRNIRKGVFCTVKKLERLKLDGNPIESIEASAFCQLNGLIELSLERCRLKSIDSEMFNSLVSLNKLTLSNNLIERIEVVTEDGRRINVAKADLNIEEKELIKKHLFQELLFLREFNLNGNKLEKLDLNCFTNLEFLSYQRLSSNKINELSGKVGPDLLSNLRVLELNDNLLTAIDANGLPKSLHYLKLFNNRLKRLGDDFFAEFNELRKVYLANNELTWSITEATFAGCRDTLEEITFSQNESIRFTKEAFREMPNLQWIDCDFNGDDADCSIKSLTRIPDSTSEVKMLGTDIFNLDWIPNKEYLKKLDFSSNRIETLDDPELLADFKKIYTIDLNNNRLRRLHRDIFRPVFNLNTINLSGNQLSSIDMGLFRHLANLEHLNLSSNGISFINLARLFRICPCLLSLNIAANQLDDRSTAEPIDARSSYKLIELVLANNRLEKIDFVRDMTSLQRLNLGCNRIGSVMSNNGENLLGRLFKLTHLDLCGNQICSLRDEMFDHIRHQLKHLDLSSNPLDIQLDSILIELI